MSIRTLEEFYAETQVLVDALAASGHITESERVNELVFKAAWTTSSELLGEATLLFKELKPVAPSQLQHRLQECLYFAMNHRKILKLP